MRLKETWLAITDPNVHSDRRSTVRTAGWLRSQTGRRRKPAADHGRHLDEELEQVPGGGAQAEDQQGGLVAGESRAR